MSVICKKPVRKIGRSARSITGYASLFRESVQFESSLEHDFLVRVALTPSVVRVVSQPVRISYVKPSTGPTTYTPDFLVEYRQERGALRQVFYEIKYRVDLREHWETLKLAFRAAIDWSREHGVEFRLVTETKIRDDAIWNAILLKRYLRVPDDPDMTLRIRRTASTGKAISIAELTRSVAAEPAEQERASAYVLKKRQIAIDLLPCEERTVQHYGVQVDYLNYYSPVLNPLIRGNAVLPRDRKKKYIVRYDPRDMSQVLFFDHHAGQHHWIPLARPNTPAFSRWEWNKVRAEMKQRGEDTRNERLFFAAMARFRDRIAESERATAAAKVGRRINENALNAERARAENRARIPTGLDASLAADTAATVVPLRAASGGASRKTYFGDD
ncbi:MAG: TnsA endonuclease N-terminal domain-containing protein [Rubrimonas sp.]